MARALGRFRIRFVLSAALTASFLLPSPAPTLAADDASIAGAFVYPVGDELDYTKGRPGEGGGFYLSDPYLAPRSATRRQKARIHGGIDLSNRRGGAEVRAIASGVVVVADRNALIKFRKRVKTKVSK